VLRQGFGVTSVTAALNRKRKELLLNCQYPKVETSVNKNWNTDFMFVDLPTEPISNAPLQ
jgi:hypothetical protein